VVEEGMAEAAPAVGGGADSSVAGIEGAGAGEAAEVAEGEIICNIPRFYQILGEFFLLLF
jgi:hypothetical protein